MARCPSTLHATDDVNERAVRCDSDAGHALPSVPHSHTVIAHGGSVVSCVSWSDGPWCHDSDV